MQRPIFIVGCPRSGTTLVRVMLDGHSRLAITQETDLIVRLDDPRPRSLDPVLDEIFIDRTVERWRIPEDRFREFVKERAPTTYAELLNAVFSGFATARGKQRWGVKMPSYVLHIPRLAELFPDAQFVHVVRDGREVAASLVERPWGPRRAVTAALQWVRAVRAGRKAGQGLGTDRYLEIRLEDLIASPQDRLMQICRFLGEEYEPAMLDYPKRAAAGPLAGQRDHEHVGRPPTAGLRDWRAGLSRRDQSAVETACRPLLAELGYPPGPASVAGSLSVAKERLRERLWRASRAIRPRRSVVAE